MKNVSAPLEFNTATAPAAGTLMRWLPIILPIALGSYVHHTTGNDGVVGIIVGAAMIARLLVISGKPTEAFTPTSRMLLRWKPFVMTLGFLAMIGGSLDALGLL